MSNQRETFDTIAAWQQETFPTATPGSGSLSGRSVAVIIVGRSA